MTRKEQDKLWADLSKESKEKIKRNYNTLQSGLSTGLLEDENLAEQIGRIKELEYMFGNHNLQPSLTYEDVARELFVDKTVYFFNWDEHDKIDSAIHCKAEGWYKAPLNCASERQAEKLQAINKLLNVAKFLNKNEDGSDWAPDWENQNEKKWGIDLTNGEITVTSTHTYLTSVVYFRTAELAQQAIQILGEDVIRTALMSESVGQDQETVIGIRASSNLMTLLKNQKFKNNKTMENKHKQFKPYERVLVRDSQDIWQIDFYSHWNKQYKQHITLAYGDGLKIDDFDILPYEGNEHLVGSKDEPEELISLEDGEWIFASNNNSDDITEWDLQQCSKIDGNSIKTKTNHYYHFFIRFADFNPNNIAETRKHTLCVWDNKVMNYNRS